jgi:hypothetical protein
VSHITREKTWGTIDLITHEGRIFFQQRWKYNWLATPPVSPWTLAEKRRFHNSVDTQIWRHWSNRIRFAITGSAPLCRRYREISINFDARWVLSNEHWTVAASKLPAGSTPTTVISNVDRANMTINLDSADLASYEACNAAGRCRDFRAVPHEFGHTFPGVNDEYNAGHPNLGDTDSRMNIGDQLRTRHLQPLLNELNTMVADCTFSHP